MDFREIYPTETYYTRTGDHLKSLLRGCMRKDETSYRLFTWVVKSVDTIVGNGVKYGLFSSTVMLRRIHGSRRTQYYCCSAVTMAMLSGGRAVAMIRCHIVVKS